NDVWSSGNGIDWTQTLPAPPWAARVYHQALVFNGEMWVIGGWDGVAYVPRNADVWHSPDGINWTQSVATAPWPGRNFFGAVVHSGRMWIMGGFDGNVGMNDVWSSSDGVSWTRATAGASWKKRTAISVLDYSGRMWLLGGFDPTNSGTFADVWSSTDGATWLQETANAWPTRNAHSAAVYQGAMWIMGGATTALDYADVWTSTNGVSWTRATDSAWPKRWGQTSVVFDNKLWILGGVDPAISAIYHDVWYVDAGASLSGQVTAASTGAPAACSAVVVTPLGVPRDLIPWRSTRRDSTARAGRLRYQRARSH
ncbi:MAG: hypothetical protein HZB26_10075, partial [Candidatus Hydrogenedentes bacterium]|nr:hypothetical protein [Candidatus Hydrogenedentota bacterium]